MKISAVKEWRPAAVKQQIRMDVPIVKTDVKTRELHNVTRRSFKLHYWKILTKSTYDLVSHFIICYVESVACKRKELYLTSK